MSKSSKIIIGIIIVIIIGGIWYGASREPKEEGVIKIGFIAPLSGEAAVIGEAERNAVEMAVEEINQMEGVNGRNLEVIYEDGKCDSKEAVTVAQKLINIDGVKIILGGLCSSETLGVAPIAEANKVILFSAFSSSPDISDAGEYIFRNAPSDTHPDLIGPIISYLQQHESVAVITENSAYSMGVRQGLKERLSNIVADEIFASGENDFKTYLTKIKSKNPEALFINAATRAQTPGFIVKQARELDLEVNLYGNFLLVGSDAIKVAGDLLEEAIVCDAPLLDESNIVAKTFMEKYVARYEKEPFSFWGAGARYDTVHIMRNALEKCGENTDCIKDFLYSMDWYEGTVAKYKFDENGDVVGIKGVVKKIVNGKPEVIK